MKNVVIKSICRILTVLLALQLCEVRVDAATMSGGTLLAGSYSSGHNYYKGLSNAQAKQADMIAKSIADSIMSNPSYTTDLQRVTAASQAVEAYKYSGIYGMDNMKYYRSPYGLFVAGVYTCAGTTRSLGRVLDYMGYKWQHTNENQYRHQWCVLTMDGQMGFADGMAGIAGYGTYYNGMILPDGTQVFYAE